MAVNARQCLTFLVQNQSRLGAWGRCVLWLLNVPILLYPYTVGRATVLSGLFHMGTNTIHQGSVPMIPSPNTITFSMKILLLEFWSREEYKHWIIENTGQYLNAFNVTVCILIICTKNMFLHVKSPRCMCLYMCLHPVYFRQWTTQITFVNILCDGNCKHFHNSHQDSITMSATAISQSLFYVGFYCFDKHKDQKWIGDNGFIVSYSLIDQSWREAKARTQAG